MGIPRFYGDWIRNKDYKGLISRRLPENVASLSLDMNGLIHDCLQQVYAIGKYADVARSKLIQQKDAEYLEATLHQTIASKIMELYSNVRPQNVLCLAVDGVAPRAKINQQRQRRYRAGKNPQSPLFDTNAVTPGTDFMFRLDSFLQDWLQANKARLPPKVIYSSHRVEGEGEHKIFDLMRSGQIADTGAHVLYGLDADFFMLSMLAPFDNIYLMREGRPEVTSISALKRGLNGEMGSISGYSDFVLMMYLVGNDFLPVSPGLEELASSVDFLLGIYKELKKDPAFLGLTRGAGIDWDGVAMLFQKLSLHEPHLLQQVAMRVYRYPSPMFKEATTDIQVLGQPLKKKFDAERFRGLWYQNELGPRGDVASAVSFLGGEAPFPVTQEAIVEMCNNYMSGLAWTFLYYKQGTSAINPGYLYRYYHAPLFTDLAVVTEAYKGNYLEPFAVGADTPPAFGIPEQLLAVLPPQSVNLLPRELQRFMQPDSFIADMFPKDFRVELENKNEEHHALVILPPVEAERIVRAVQSVPWAPERLELYSPGEDLVIESGEAPPRTFRQAEERYRTGQSEYRGRGRGSYTRGGERGRGRGGRGGYIQREYEIQPQRTTTPAWMRAETLL